MSLMSGELTGSQVKRAGKIIRRLHRGEMPSPEDFGIALETIRMFRAAHAIPLVTANNGLRSMVRTEGCAVEVSQRLKRMSTILDKLRREPTLALNKMQDIAGVRAVLESIDEIRRVEARLKKNRPVTGYSDYIENPRESGYRGVHVIVEYGSRQIEVQLRTHVMHEWAITVERLTSRVGHNLKGDGDHELQLLMAAISEAMAMEERGETVPDQLHLLIRQLRTAAQPYLGA